MADPVKDACVRGDAAWLAGWLSGRLMLNVPVRRVEGWLLRLNDLMAEPYWRAHGYPSGGWLDLWFRKRMTDDNLFQAGCRGQPLGHLSVELHMGFVHIWETEEELERLRYYDNSKVPSGPATPGIERTQVKVQPIDRVALRVAPVERPSPEG